MGIYQRERSLLLQAIKGVTWIMLVVFCHGCGRRLQTWAPLSLTWVLSVGTGFEPRYCSL